MDPAVQAPVVQGLTVVGLFLCFWHQAPKVLVILGVIRVFFMLMNGWGLGTLDSFWMGTAPQKDPLEGWNFRSHP